MNKSGFFIGIISMLILATSCDDEKGVKVENEEIGTPPSLVSDSAQKQMIELSDKEVKELKIKTVDVTSDVKNYKVIAPGMTEPHPKDVSIISAPIEGRVAKILAFEGDYVQKGSIILQMESLTYGSLVAEYVQAKSEETYQQSRLDRMKQLVEKDINSESDLEKARADYQRASASVNAAYSKLKAIGVADRDIDNLKPNKKIKPLLNIYAPISGTIDQRQIEQGEAVNAYEKLERIINPGRVMVKAYLSPEDGQFVKKGDQTNIMRRQNREKFIEGTVASINPGLDEGSRSIVANIPIRNNGNWPLPGTSVRIEIETTTPAEVIMIPMDAVTYDGNEPVVFVKHSKSLYEKRYLQISELRDRYALVQKGLEGNEKIAVSQVFTLKALSRYEKFAE
ncbi:MAG TPA: efflux RND transporter periplasmic adaptor subunit [Salinivirga sp.]|uniref:efflux RND transporter periplasmic adaptor subunit n=1 Tax=Salinivirga sp. TaxID=1970192 RepID=UPI002B46B1E0|nr:efflux RND transporter periplasmic adaptor subunit [Salinivirga sp.]HKK58017.1 efflux RND transporter periplasmic adaptor subunit [Salinivirga sp.]